MKAQRSLETRFDLIERFRRVRSFSTLICKPLEPEDYMVQSMPDVSPPKWHLAHTTWFFEAFLLSRFITQYKPFDSNYHYLFNSYYKSLGHHLDRSNRGCLSRPGLPIILKYRETTEDQLVRLLESCPEEKLGKIEEVLTLGLQHEQQHQELLVTDIKHNLCSNPLHPVFVKVEVPYLSSVSMKPMEWIDCEGGICKIGAPNGEFSFDQERPRHDVLLKDYRISSRLVTNHEYTEFIEDEGYSRPELWLSLGWDTVVKDGWQAPLYWRRQDNQWWVETLNGFERVNPSEPVCHVSFFEADAYARWKRARLLTEAEWEAAAQSHSGDELHQGNFLDMEVLRPRPAASTPRLQQMYGDVWEWTSSAYLPYPGFVPLNGSEGEYNGKFMCNQMVLRGGSCATPRGHIRPSYRNFFPPHSRWQFTGIRLAQDFEERNQ